MILGIWYSPTGVYYIVMHGYMTQGYSGTGVYDIGCMVQLVHRHVWWFVQAVFYSSNPTFQHAVLILLIMYAMLDFTVYISDMAISNNIDIRIAPMVDPKAELPGASRTSFVVF